MNTKSTILTGLLLFILLKLSAQSIGYTYDANGNRVSRELIVEQLKSATTLAGSTSKKDVIDPLQKPEDITEAPEVHVYPNPTKGILKVEIKNLSPGSSREMTIYDLAGRRVLVKENFENYSECDLNSLKDGIYILRIKIDEKTLDWKVIKNNF